MLPLCLLGVLFFSCKDRSNNKNTAKPIEVPVVTIETSLVELDRLYVSDIQAIRNVEIRSKISGFLDGINVDEGERVKKGQVLFRIGDNEYKAEVAKARAVLNSVKAETRIAELEYDWVKLMVDKKIISQSELELAGSKLNSAKAKTQEAESSLQQAIHRLSYTVICSPFDGIVDRIPLKAGSLLSEGTLITTASDISYMYAYFNISENEYLALSKKTDSSQADENRIASLILSNGQEYAYKGKVELVVSEFNEGTGSISVRAKFPNPENLLKHKATGKVKLTSGKVESLVVPQKATFEIQDKSYVYVLDSTNEIKMRSFVPSERIGQFYIVTSGLQKGERVVYEGIQNLKEGVKVMPRMVPRDSLPQIPAL